VARIKQPQLPAGALRDFFEALHDLHLKAGYPSTREIEKDIGRGVVSHTTIHKALKGPRLPGWGIVELLVEALAKRSREDVDAVAERFRSLWQNAAESLPGHSEADVDKVRHVTLAARETIQSRAALPFAQLLGNTLDEIEAAATYGTVGMAVPTGFADVDTLTGGLRAGSLIVIASRSSIGKSMLAISICTNAAMMHGMPCALFSCEMSESEIQMRILSAQARVPHHSLRAGMMTEDEWTRLARRMSEVVDAPLWLSYSPSMTMGDLEGESKTLKDERGLKFLAIDNIDPLLRRVDEPEEILYDDLKQLAADLGVPILITTHMRNASETGSYRRPEIADLPHAGSIEAVADILILLDRLDAYDLESPRAGEIDLMFVKNRHGPAATVTLAFQAHYCRIVDLFISNEQSTRSGPVAATQPGTPAPTDR
jgi:replicative DNA helicase